MAKTGTTTQGLRTAIERSGYYPALVAEAVEAAVGGEPIASYLVHQETTFDSNEVRRHVTVLVLTAHRFIVSHTDEQAADTSSPTPYATTSTESVKLDRISSVVVSRVVANPESYTPAPCPARSSSPSAGAPSPGSIWSPPPAATPTARRTTATRATPPPTT